MALAVGAVVVVGLGACGSEDPADPVDRADLPTRFTARITDVVDGDTVRIEGPSGRETVRLIGIDTPETKRPGSPVECFGPQASERTREMLPDGTTVGIELDDTQDRTDRYDRLLAYVHLDDEPRVGPVSVNRSLVESGYAKVYVYRGRPFRYTEAYRRAERIAQERRRGLWGRCETGAPAGRERQAAVGSEPASGACDPAYVGACVPPPPPDLDCADIAGEVRVVGPDRHRLDGDGDGLACR